MIGIHLYVVNTICVGVCFHNVSRWSRFLPIDFHLNQMINVFQCCQLSIMSAFFLKQCFNEGKPRWHIPTDCRVLAFYLQIAKSNSPFTGLLSSVGEWTGTGKGDTLLGVNELHSWVKKQPVLLFYEASLLWNKIYGEIWCMLLSVIILDKRLDIAVSEALI